jgi:hypothetical protein
MDYGQFSEVESSMANAPNSFGSVSMSNIPRDYDDTYDMKLDLNPVPPPSPSPRTYTPFPRASVTVPVVPVVPVRHTRPGQGISAHAKRKMEFSTIPQITGRKRKRQKIKDQMKGSIDSPPEICYGIRGVDTSDITTESGGNDMKVDGLSGLMMVDRGLTYYCPSKTTPGDFYRIGLKIENGQTSFSCTCDHMMGAFDSSKNSCSHIRATVIKIMLDLIQTHQSALDVNNITDLMNAMMV